MKKFAQRFVQRSQSGQSLVILAIGFVALLGFVGIVTDVSLMFVRFNTLTRAVDAASIAAAGQVRRQVPFQSEINDHCTGTDPDGNPWTPDNPCDEAEAAAFGRSFGNIGIAARQYIEFYGLDPQAVLIDMCFTVSKVEEVDGEPQRVPLDGMDEEFEALCEGDKSDRKLIQLTAQIDSPTVFMRLLGFPDITLEATSISETAVLDVVLIMDVSESMLNQTTYDEWVEAGYYEVYRPPDVGFYNYWHTNDDTLNDGFGPERVDPDNPGVEAPHNFANLTHFDDYSDNLDLAWYRFREDLAGLSTDEANGLLWSGEPVFEVEVARHPDAPEGEASKPLRNACKVTYYPNSRNYKVSDYLNDLYLEAFGRRWEEPFNDWTGFVPTYDHYRCCNDPDGDGYFNDLICQPFREARDATELFIKRIDFLRGDRVAFVTFDRQAFLVNVEVDEENNVWSHMIDNEAKALETLTQSIGVRAEPSFYEPQVGQDGQGNPLPGVPWQRDGSGAIRSSQLGIHDYEVRNNCPFQDAALAWPWSPVSRPSAANVSNLGLPPGEYDPYRSPNLLEPDAFSGGGLDGDGLGQRMFPRGPAFEGHSSYGALRSYDMWASCSGTNIGAALREGSNALVAPATTRTNGAVWIMVMLSDGAAGASDMVYGFDGNPPGPTDAAYVYNDEDDRVDYGRFGLCPAGLGPNDTELSQFDESPFGFPYCSDNPPETRHFCFDPELAPVYVDLSASDCDRHFYDVDDYARDWADWIGLVDPPAGGPNIQRNLTQLPTIFTIGFGLNFTNGTQRCVGGLASEGEGLVMDGDEGDCLGEELLRYIADVGDNFEIDTDHQQLLLEQEYGDGNLTNEEFGPRGECEEDLDDPAGKSFDDLLEPLPAGESCGNYYNAPDSEELGRVFDDIALRMFTRLTQ